MRRFRLIIPYLGWPWVIKIVGLVTIAVMATFLRPIVWIQQWTLKRD